MQHHINFSIRIPQCTMDEIDELRVWKSKQTGEITPRSHIARMAIRLGLRELKEMAND